MVDFVRLGNKLSELHATRVKLPSPLPYSDDIAYKLHTEENIWTATAIDLDSY
jgi:hypothetical protein